MKFKTALDYLCERWQNSKRFAGQLRERLAAAQPGSKDHVFYSRRVKQIEIEAGLWEGRVKEGDKKCAFQRAN